MFDLNNSLEGFDLIKKIKKINLEKIFLSDFFTSFIAIIVGLLLGFLVMILTNFSQSLDGISAILFSPISSLKNIGQVLYFAPPIILTGLSVCFANEIGLFNIGTPGQFIIGAYLAVFVGAKINFINNKTHCVLAIVLSFIAGALCGLIPGILKAFSNVNEVISCIMINYISMYLVNFLVKKNIFDITKNQSKRVLDSAILPKFILEKIFPGSNVNLSIFIAIIIAIFIYIILEKTNFGFELKTCGLNHYAARYIGINEKKILIINMMISGGLAGLGGGLLYLSNIGNHLQVIDTLAPEGFLGIPIALLAFNKPIAIIFTGLFIAYLTVGGFNIQIYNFVPQLVEIVISIIIYSSALGLLIKKLLSKKNKR
jgi:simple sugar transport system permease protein